jgi:hypothetical protein
VYFVIDAICAPFRPISRTNEHSQAESLGYHVKAFQAEDIRHFIAMQQTEQSSRNGKVLMRSFSALLALRR